MKKVGIVGLGNMGPDYDNTRHNIGFEIVDYLAKEFEVEFKNDQLGDIAEFRHKGRTFILLKPSTYMNLNRVKDPENLSVCQAKTPLRGKAGRNDYKIFEDNR